MKIDRERLYKDILDIKGQDSQLNQLIEECAELIQSVTKLKRLKDVSYNGFIDELSDVEIMIEQIKIMFSMHNDVNKAKERKIKRIAKKLKDGTL